MKKFEELKLNQHSKTELGKKQMNSIKGGVECACSCSSGLTFGLSQTQGKTSNLCEGNICICQCPPETQTYITNDISANAALL